MRAKSVSFFPGRVRINKTFPEVAEASPLAPKYGRVGALWDAVVGFREELIGTLLG